VKDPARGTIYLCVVDEHRRAVSERLWEGDALVGGSDARKDGYAGGI